MLTSGRIDVLLPKTPTAGALCCTAAQLLANAAPKEAVTCCRSETECIEQRSVSAALKGRCIELVKGVVFCFLAALLITSCSRRSPSAAPKGRCIEGGSASAAAEEAATCYRSEAECIDGGEVSRVNSERQASQGVPYKSEGKNALHVVATFYPLYIMCLNITDGADNVEISCLAPAETGCLHDYSLTTRDAARIDTADIIIANGAGMETFLLQLLETKKNVIEAAKGYPLIEGNPHIFVSVSGARYEANNIAAGLIALDKAHAAIYTENAKKYDDKLFRLSDEMHGMLLPYKGRSIVTFHEAFPYFAEEFGFSVLAVIEHEGGGAPSAKEAVQTVRIIKTNIEKGNPPALFADRQYPSSSAHLIEAETGLILHSLDPCVTGEVSKDAYIKAQHENALSLVTAFSGK